jgi:hypothetical protein
MAYVYTITVRPHDGILAAETENGHSRATVEEWLRVGPPIVVFAHDLGGMTFYVYRGTPTPQNPYGFWKYYPVTLATEDLPDIRIARPLYTYNSATLRYTPVEYIVVKY